MCKNPVQEVKNNKCFSFILSFLFLLLIFTYLFNQKIIQTICNWEAGTTVDIGQL